MKEFFKNKANQRFLVGYLLVVALVAIPVSFQATSISLPDYKEDTGYAVSESIVEDGDFNVTNNLPDKLTWVVSHSYNYGGALDLGAAVLNYPFMALAQFQKGTLFVTDNCKFENNAAAFFVANVFYVLLFLWLGIKILSHISLSQEAKFIGLLTVLGTPIFWFLFFEPTGAILPATAILSLAIYFMLKIEEASFKATSYFLLGTLFALAFAAKNDLLFYAIVPLLFYFERRDYSGLLKKYAFYVAGFAFVSVVYLYLEILRVGSFRTFITMSKFSARLLVFPFEYFRTLVGPNGIFIISPIIGLAFLALVKVTVDWVERKHKLDTAQKLAVSLLPALLLTLIFNPKLLFELKFFGGGQFISQYILVAIGLSFFLKEIPESKLKFAKAFLGLLGITNIIWALKYFGDRNSFGIGFSQQTADFWKVISENFSRELPYVLSGYPSAFFHLFYVWIVQAFILFKFFQFLRKKNVSLLRVSALILVISLILTTSFQFRNGARNILLDRTQGIYKNKVRGAGPFLLMYDDLMTSLQLLLAQSYQSGSVARAQDLTDKIKSVAKRADRSTVYFAPGHIVMINREGYIKPPIKPPFYGRVREFFFKCPGEPTK